MKILFFVFSFVIGLVIAILSWNYSREEAQLECLLAESSFYQIAIREENRIIKILERVKTPEDLVRYKDRLSRVCEVMRMWSEVYGKHMAIWPSSECYDDYTEPHLPASFVQWAEEHEKRKQELLGLSPEEMEYPLGKDRWEEEEYRELRRQVSELFWKKSYERRERIRYLMSRLETTGWNVVFFRGYLFAIVDDPWGRTNKKMLFLDEESWLKGFYQNVRVDREWRY